MYAPYVYIAAVHKAVTGIFHAVVVLQSVHSGKRQSATAAARIVDSDYLVLLHKRFYAVLRQGHFGTELGNMIRRKKLAGFLIALIGVRNNSMAFICDVSLICSANNKGIVNPNVMFELGYAIKTHYLMKG